jgi:hypothetical protein
MLYQWGRGVPRDLNRAYFWKLLSLDEHDSQQVGELRDLSYNMTDKDVADMAQQASEWRAQQKKQQLPELLLP